MNSSAAMNPKAAFRRDRVFEFLIPKQVDNLELSMSGTRKLWSTFRARLDSETMDRIEAMSVTIDLLGQLHAQAGSLSHGQKQWLEIGMLIMQNPVLLLVDGPAAGMTHQEMDRTVELLTSLAGEHAIVVVEHDMDFVRDLDSPVTVLHQGSVLAEGSMSDIQSNADVMRVYLGTEDASC